MNILYLGRHGQKNNDDEGSIAAAIRDLGHTLHCLNPEQVNITMYRDFYYDLCLFHKLSDRNIRLACDYWPTAAWFFDPLNKGFAHNDNYVNSIKDKVTYGFFTDGDFVHDEGRDNFFELKQGLDLDNIPDFVAPDKYMKDVQFIGQIGPSGYSIRENYLQALEESYNGSIHLEYNVFKESLTAVCQNVKIMMGMVPVTDNYWSNRVYLLGGRGAFVLHPYSKSLSEEFGDLLPMFHTMDDMIDKIEYWKPRDKERAEIQVELQKRIKEKHTYKHRVKELLGKI